MPICGPSPQANLQATQILAMDVLMKGQALFITRASGAAALQLRSAWAAAAAVPRLQWWGPGTGMVLIFLPSSCSSDLQQCGEADLGACRLPPHALERSRPRARCCSRGGNTLVAALGGRAVEEVLGKPGPRPPKASKRCCALPIAFMNPLLWACDWQHHYLVAAVSWHLPPHHRFRPQADAAPPVHWPGCRQWSRRSHRQQRSLWRR